ncbi:hypothetical protein OQJ46_02775 [Microbulbifer thermotolerans]|nr:hypothetical protein [Microbulbifer thermotolerans]AMX02210.1 hypothetical protein A3224_06090 [Microbulbifer thermotolerans]MCX2781912.1 hypothetical protein [Microbulbifer thermotolerans]MCX2804121.1 hypothetical protein [Microbulbifer thermotolerans]MCX2834746.1 hypothetical protein [Microbulbifer thermotolerans]MCX2841139.1 hypothetical protein [Microbulbifer thermotolerans]
MKNTLSFKEFWHWLTEHPNCILRAGTADSVVFDDDDYHWRFSEEDVRTLLVQVMRGKRPVAEMFIEPEHVTAVKITPGEKGEYNFDLVAEIQGQPQVIYYFVLTHSYEAPDQSPRASGHRRLH